MKHVKIMYRRKSILYYELCYIYLKVYLYLYYTKRTKHRLDHILIIIDHHAQSMVIRKSMVCKKNSP